MLHSLDKAQQNLARHPVFATLTELTRVQRFMESHVWAVWDFMSLLKRLQREITCVELPWRPSCYSGEMVRFINQIVLGEESDVDASGRAVSHFQLYLEAMLEVGADPGPVLAFLHDLDLARLPAHARRFTGHTLQVAQHGDVVEVAAAFFYGREKAIPEMFQSIVDVLRREGLNCPKLLYYLERHIHVDGEEHGPLSERCLAELCGEDETKLGLAHRAGLKALEARQRFWDETLVTLQSGTHAAL